MKEVRNSKKRDAILEAFKNGHLFTAQEISKKLPKIDTATIYRNIDFFIKEGILREIHIKKGVSSYELVNENNHQHFICDKCEKVIPININLNNFSKLFPKDIEVKNLEFNITGNCKNCTDK